MIVGFLAIYGVSNAQNIHIDDFDYFVGCFERTDPQDRESIDCSEFSEWYIVKPDVNGTRDLRSIESPDRYKHWVYDWKPLTNQSRTPGGGKYRQSSRGFEFYILMDFFGYERRLNVLTAWKRIGRDSLRYHCGQVDIVDSFIGSSRIEHVGTFPDNLIFLVVKSEGEGYRGYKFLRGSPDCDFEIFYENHWSMPFGDSDGSYTNIHYNFEHLRRSSFKATEVREDITIEYNDSVPGGLQVSVDSANVKILDLWEMAKEHFNIESE
jgi:hypothetical protein